MDTAFLDGWIEGSGSESKDGVVVCEDIKRPGC